MNWSNMLSLTVWKFTDDNVAKLKLGLALDKPWQKFHYILVLKKIKMCDRGCFSQMGEVLFVSLRVSKLQKLEKGSIL